MTPTEQVHLLHTSTAAGLEMQRKSSIVEYLSGIFFTSSFAVIHFLLSPKQFTHLHIFPKDVISRATVDTSLFVSFSPHNVTFSEVSGSKVHRVLMITKSQSESTVPQAKGSRTFWTVLESTGSAKALGDQSYLLDTLPSQPAATGVSQASSLTCS